MTLCGRLCGIFEGSRPKFDGGEWKNGRHRLRIGGVFDGHRQSATLVKMTDDALMSPDGADEVSKRSAQSFPPKLMIENGRNHRQHFPQGSSSYRRNNRADVCGSSPFHWIFISRNFYELLPGRTQRNATERNGTQRDATGRNGMGRIDVNG